MAAANAPDYDRLTHLLAGVELAPSPAEAQGILCGLLALHLPDPLERWHAQLSAASIECHCDAHDHGHSHADDHAHAHAEAEAEAEADGRRVALDQLAAWTQSAIDPPSVSFELFLPPDDWPLHQRAIAVLDWVRGLLFGLVLGGLEPEQLIGQAGEVFDDLVELTRMDLEAVAEEDDDEEDEQALTEIVEFLRVAAMLIREDRAKALIEERDRQAVETGLH